MEKGKIIKNYNGYYYVDLGQPDLTECRLRGRLKKSGRLLVGDNVEIELLDHNKGVINQVSPRINEIRRPLLANIDQMFIIMAAKSPDPNRFLLDKLILTCEYSGIHPFICFNKCDLNVKIAEEYQSFYNACGYDVFLVSAETGAGIDTIINLLAGKTSAFAGPSGVGKSSLLSRILDRTDLSIGSVSEKIKRGRHTTRHSEIMKYSKDTYVVDTPGFSSLDFSHLEERELLPLFPDMYPYSATCRFSSCLHRSEPDCGVKEALATGRIKKERYDTYCSILDSILERKNKL